MKRVTVTILALCFLMSGACSFSKNAILNTPEDQADTIKYSLRVFGFKSEVTVEDVDDNGIVDFYIIITNISKKPAPKRMHLIFAYVTGIMSGIENRINERSDKVYLEILDDIYVSTVQGCVECSKAGSKEIDECIDNIWRPKSEVDRWRDI